MTAKEIAEKQRCKDLAHHKNRIKWLEVSDPKWSCGTPVLPSDKNQMLTASYNVLRNPMSGSGTCQCLPGCAEIQQ